MSRRAFRRACAGLVLAGLAALAPVLEAAGKQGTIEIYFGRYAVRDDRFKAVYETSGPIQGVVLSADLAGGFDFYGEIKAFGRTGALTFTGEEAKLFLLPLSFGLRWVYPGAYVRPYAGAGAEAMFYHESSPLGTTLDVGYGFHVLGGVYLKLGRSVPVLLNARIKYSRVRAVEEEAAVELGGFEFGGGLAIIF